MSLRIFTIKRYKLLKDTPTIKAGEKYKYYVYDDVRIETWYGTRVDIYRFDVGSCYPLDTPDEAIIREQYEIPKVINTIKDDACVFDIDWGYYDQEKWSGYYDHETKTLIAEFANDIQPQGAIFFVSKADIEASFKKHRKEWLLVLGVEG